MVSLGDMSSQQLQQLAVSADSMMSQNWTWVRLYGPNPTRHTQMTRPTTYVKKNSRIQHNPWQHDDQLITYTGDNYISKLMRNSAIADKPRDAFVQTFGVADLLKNTPLPICVTMPWSGRWWRWLRWNSENVQINLPNSLVISPLPTNITNSVRLHADGRPSRRSTVNQQCRSTEGVILQRAKWKK